jgi:amino acid adenylation domain-containing protein
VEVLRQALDEVCRTHEIWRTSFHEVERQPMAVVHESQEIDLLVVDLRTRALAERDAEDVRLAGLSARRPFDLEGGPLVRFLLVSMSNAEQRLHLTFHQIIADRQSIHNSFLPELATIYEDFVSGRPISMGDPPLQFQDFVRWERVTHSDVQLGELAVRRGQIEDPQPTFGLPTDQPRTSVPSDAGEEVSFILPEQPTDKVRAFSQREGISLDVVLLTAFAVLLARRSGDEIQSIRIITSLRQRSEFESVPGPFRTTVALRLDLSGDPPFREALGRVRDVLLDGPRQELVRSGDVSTRDANVDVLFRFEPTPREPPIGWEVAPQAVDVSRSAVDLQLLLEEWPDKTVGRMRFATALFERATVEALTRQFLTLVQAAIREPGRPIGDLAVLTENDRASILAARNRVAPTTPFEPFSLDQIEQSIGMRFARQVAAFGDRPAVIDAGRTWTYAELDTAAGAVAHAIAMASTANHPQVGLLGQPGGQMIAAILGILKAGGAYVPLDPQFPAKRIHWIAEDAGLDVIVVGEGLSDLVREIRNEAIPKLDLAVATSGPALNPMGRAGPGDAAYLLYTSGSTGDPKGVMQSHRNVLHDARVYANSVHLEPNDRVLLAARPAFRAGMLDVFAALLTGAALCVVDLAAVGFLGLRDVMVDLGVTVYHSTPTVYRELIGTLDAQARLDDVRVVVLGGEEVRAADFDLFLRHFTSKSLFINILGSTESLLALQFFADPMTTLNRTRVPVGYPVEATEVLLLDPYGRENDFIGEIAIRSRYVARGYWNRPDLTAVAFTVDTTDPSLITYRSGDLGRRLADGSIEFIGRRDRQVKIRGIRIEVGEIERALSLLPDVKQVAVEARLVDGETELVAYLEGSNAHQLSPLEVRSVLRQQLPEYMIPKAIVWLDRMPRTTSNKINRQALPAPPTEVRSASLAAPRDDLEERLIRIWEAALSRHPIGIDDDFFDLGGHSLLAVRVFDRIWRDTGQRVPLSVLLERATIAHVATRIRDGQRADMSALIVVQPRGTKRPLFIVPGAGSRILYLRNLAVHLGSDQPLYALHAPPGGPLGHAERRIEDLAGHYLAALREIQPDGPYDLVGFSFGGPVAYEVAQQLIAGGEKVGLLALIDSRHPMQPLPQLGFHLSFVARRFANQARIVRRLGVRRGGSYLRRRLWIARMNSLEALRELLSSKLPQWLARPMRDNALEEDRMWLAADARAYNRYEPAPYPGRITFLWAEHNQRSANVFDTRRLWPEVALGGFDVRPIPGSHLTVLVEPLVSITAAVLADALATARESLAAPGLLQTADAASLTHTARA